MLPLKWIFLLVTLLHYVSSDATGQAEKCECINRNCKCCAQLDIESLTGKVSWEVCGRVVYHPEYFGTYSTIFVNGEEKYSSKIYVTSKDPPAICHYPTIKENIHKLCLHLHVILYSQTELFAQSRIVAYWDYNDNNNKTVELGRFTCKNR